LQLKHNYITSSSTTFGLEWSFRTKTRLQSKIETDLAYAGLNSDHVEF